MARDIFTNLMTDLRFPLDTETDYDSPDNQNLRDALRQAIESIFVLVSGVVGSGTFTSDPSNDANGYAYDSAAGWTDDEHNKHTLLICTGAGKGYFLTIDDTVAASNRIACTGDNLYSLGVRSGHEYIILRDIKTVTDGHRHNGQDSHTVNLPEGSIMLPFIMSEDETELASSSGEGGASMHTPISNTYKIVIPMDPPTLYCRIRGWENVGDTAYWSFSVGSQNATSQNTNDSTPTWREFSLDVSSLQGTIQDLTINAWCSDSSYTDRTQGWFLWWGGV